MSQGETGMSSIELNWLQSGADMEWLTVAVMNAVSAAIDEGRHETTYLTVDGELVAVIAPYEPVRVQSNTFACSARWEFADDGPGEPQDRGDQRKDDGHEDQQAQ
jgi:hypothetical protein